jgi:hypothetical protein
MLNTRKTSSLKKELTNLFHKGISSGLVAKENPLQQGLKHETFLVGTVEPMLVAKENPLQQGLKPTWQP